ncbi:keratin-associated protein 5-1 [Anopheles gambiae]|uniref:keratin-associated protein 5-1 n=1 Tax=Anopheles gambiae TaxID=7165 RepID=UPI002AC96F8A|nr:keratin-associated protein 5-1 [Anopheles gambiae]
MPCKTCGQDCKCLRMMSKRSCGTRSCDSGCTCSCNTATPCRSTGAQPGPDGQPEGAAGRQRSEGGPTGCCCATADGGEDGASAGCGDACTC